MKKENKRELLQAALNMEPTERIPVGFWWHYIQGDDLVKGYLDDNVISTVLEGHKKMYDEFQPDFVKLMSDGFFSHPALHENSVHSVEDLKKIKSIGRNHPWIQKQVEMAKEITEYYNGEIMAFYNVFSVMQAMRLNIKYSWIDAAAFEELMMKHPKEVSDAAMIIAEDIVFLLEELKNKTSIDGIYYSVQHIQHPEADEEYHRKYISPIDLFLLDKINELWENNILHICGYAHFKNNVSFYNNYKAKAYNWAVHTDKVSLVEGKKIFDAAVIGGFDNNPNTLLDKGSLEDIESFVHQLIEETGREGLIIGADCTVPGDIDINRLKFVREIAK